MNEIRYDNESNDPSMWTSDKQMAEMNKPGKASQFPAPTGPPGFFLGPWGGVIGLGVIGFLAGLFWSSGSLIGALAGTALLAFPAYLFKLAFSATFVRPRAVKFAATGAIAGVILAIVIDTASEASTPLVLAALLGAVAGVVVSFFRKAPAKR